MKPFVLVFVMALAALIFASTPSPTEAHSASWSYQLSCGYYSATLTLNRDAVGENGQHRVIITKNNIVVAKQDYSQNATYQSYVVAGRLPIYATYTAYVYDRVNGGFPYTPMIGSYFAPTNTVGLHSQSSLILASRYWCWYIR